jgi:hypothetical protein
MSSPIWTPGVAGPLEAFVERLHRRIEAFAEERGWEREWVEVEFFDGAGVSVHSITPEPGFGFVTIRPYPDEEEDGQAAQDESALPEEELIVPVGSIKRITLRRVEERRARFGFTLPSS